jgi:hypothetical protein
MKMAKEKNFLLGGRCPLSTTIGAVTMAGPVFS